MQATETGQGAASGATVQRDPDGAARVVVECDRCDHEVPMELEPLVGGVGGLSARARDAVTSYATLTIGTLATQPKVLRLCPGCVRAFRLFMLRAESSSLVVGERWENLICGAV